MRNIHLRYVEEEYDARGILCKYRMKCPDDFNFAYDVVDDIGINDPGRRALVWCDIHGNERTMTFGEIKRHSDKAANFFRSAGIEKGDTVLVILKNSYQFWYVLTALHKLGAIPIPATFMLKKHDVEYRVNAASIKAAICISSDGVPEAIDSAENVPTLTSKIMLGGQRDGWYDLESGVEKASDVLERVPTKATDTLIIYFSSGTSGHPKMVLQDHTYPIGHIFTAKHWHNVDPDGLHFTIADTGWAKSVWGKYYGQWIMEAG
ncbi:MAG: AMP-binding protein, partial [Methanomassiliicoccaceae archaeon]|nr:AMP-binding protein [Methanomassiliicoccaceae archaeon]